MIDDARLEDAVKKINTMPLQMAFLYYQTRKNYE